MHDKMGKFVAVVAVAKRREALCRNSAAMEIPIGR
jgi:hypothetical protein